MLWNGLSWDWQCVPAALPHVTVDQAACTACVLDRDASAVSSLLSSPHGCEVAHDDRFERSSFQRKSH